MNELEGMKLLSLFDGSGGFPLAGAMSGIIPIAASEIEPFPIRVTTKRFPNMKHIGDISKINGAEIEPVDVITFGSPCQDLSVAGQRAGMKHTENGDEETTRSGLFMEAVRIIKEMRSKTNGRYPTFAVWENVPGAYSSNKGEDFRTVLEELAKIKEGGVSIPKASKWLLAGEVVGDDYSIAWRTLDAQYWGVPQRRRRIYLVADFRGQRAGKILFEREGLRGDIAQSGTQGQGTAGNVEDGTSATDCEGKPFTLKIRSGCEGGGKGELWQEDMSATLTTNNDQYLFQPILTAELGIASRDGGHVYENIAGTLRANAGDNQLSVCYGVENHPADSRVNIDDSGKCQTLTSRMGTGGGNVPLVMEEKPVICLQGNGIDRADTAGCNGKGWKEDISYTLNTVDRPAVAYILTHQGFMVNPREGDVMDTLLASDYKDPPVIAIDRATATYPQQAYDKFVEGDIGTTLKASGGTYGGGSETLVVEPQHIVRRLTPLECCRLQGFPDWWTAGLETAEPTEEDLTFWRDVFETHRQIVTGATKPKTDKQIIKWLKDPYSDSAEYKMWGNGIALPNALFVMQGIAEELQQQQEADTMAMVCVNGVKECEGCMSCQEVQELSLHCPLCGHSLDFDDMVYRVREDDEIIGCEHCAEAVFAEDEQARLQ